MGSLEVNFYIIKYFDKNTEYNKQFPYLIGINQINTLKKSLFKRKTIQHHPDSQLAI